MTMMVNTYLSGAAYSGEMVVGHGVIEEPKGGGVNFYGYSQDIGGFGSRTPSTWRGFPLYSLYQVESGGTTDFQVTGDASAFSPVVIVNGANQNLGSGT